MEEKEYKIITLGSFSVGKTCLLIKMTQEHYNFPEGYQCTIGVDFKTKSFLHNDTNYKLTLWDTAGQERFYHINRLYYQDCNAVILVYDITNRFSFEKIESFFNDFKNCSSNNNPSAFILVGNKNDCLQREVSKDEGAMLAKKLQISFLECSAFTGENLPEIFNILIENIENGKICPKIERESIFVKKIVTKKGYVSRCC